MKWTGLNEIREKYLAFFESKQHMRLPSFPLIPQDDNTILLINAGMTPMKKYFTGEVTPPAKRVTTCQKCIRTPDIENVGITARHGTYFEMLGNFSFGDYFKHEATAWAWEFLTEVMEIPAEKLYITVYEQDDEAFEIWEKEIGVPKERIFRLGKADNFWEHGACPCGPCSEIHFDRGEQHGCGSPDCNVTCECDRFMEIWNLVFTQFKNDGKGNYEPLDHPNIDTGMGLERLACILQDVDNLFEVDTVQNIMKHIMSISGVKYHENKKNDISLRVISDHIRSTTMMIADGVIPSNEGRGYVLRRLLRRAARHGRLLGIDRPFLAEVAETVINENENAYPALREKHDYIIKIISVEEESFGKTIDSGLKLLTDLIARTQGNILSGDDAFMLSDTFGFPIDLTKEILAEKDMTVDEEIFRKLVGEQRAKARGARKDDSKNVWSNEGNALDGIPATEFTGYTSVNGNGKILAVLTQQEGSSALSQGEEGAIVLDSTSFYAESGGQISDTGIITGDSFTFEVTSVKKNANGLFLHSGVLTEGTAGVGDAVCTRVDEEKRIAITRNHTAAHLLQAALRKVLGKHVEQAGQYVSEKSVRFDFTHFSALTSEELLEVEKQVNEVILQALPVTSEEKTIAEAKAMGAMALFGEKYGERVRVVNAGNYSLELCGGTHAANTGNLGLFKILSEGGVASGVRRIEALTGMHSLSYTQSLVNTIHSTAAVLRIGNIAELENKAGLIAAELKSKDKEIEKLKAEIAKAKAADIFSNAVVINGVRIIAANIGEADANAVRTMLDSAKADDAVAVMAGIAAEKGTVTFACACGKTAIAKGAHAGNIVRQTAAIAGGAGGGKPDSAMAGGKDITKTDEALAQVTEIVRAMLK